MDGFALFIYAMEIYLVLCIFSFIVYLHVRYRVSGPVRIRRDFNRLVTFLRNLFWKKP